MELMNLYSLEMTEISSNELDTICGGVSEDSMWYKLGYMAYSLIHDVPELFK